MQEQAFQNVDHRSILSSTSIVTACMKRLSRTFMKGQYFPVRRTHFVQEHRVCILHIVYRLRPLKYVYVFMLQLNMDFLSLMQFISLADAQTEVIVEI